MRATVLGLGSMGHALAQRLLDNDFTLTVWNRSPGKAADLVEQGATEARSIAEAVRESDVVITSLTGDSAVSDVLLPDGLPVPGLDGDVIDCSTVSPETCRALAEVYPERFIAAPIAGAPQAVQNGKAILLVAGARTVVQRQETTLSAIAQSRQVIGEDPRDAAIAKLLNNYLLMAGIALLADVVAAARTAGFADDTIRDLLGSLPVVAPGLANRLDALVAGDHEGWFAVDLAVKDLDLASEATSNAPVRPALLDAVRERYRLATERGLGDRDITAVIELLHPDT